ncbi:1219_t:CDS:2 [Gigaspora rosea]|nr:1219_t:CDS:2 [Gigaspora rosea]
MPLKAKGTTKNWKIPLLEKALALWISRANAALQTVTGVKIQQSGDPPEEITIKDAIDFTAAAWKKVTSKTICNCWKKPEDFLSELFPDEELDHANEPDITNEI